MSRKRPKPIAIVNRVAEARKIVASQHGLVMTLKASGQPSLHAELALQSYVSSLKHLEDHERWIKAENKAKKGETRKKNSS